MSKFKPGDRVRCIEAGFCDVVGAVYTVSDKSDPEPGYPYFRTVELADKFPNHNFADIRYELVQSQITARKDDSGKLDMNLLDDMPRALKAIVEVMQWAIVDKKPVPYVRGSWLGVEPDRYRAASKRHERAAAEQATPEVPARLQRDDETNLLHLAHTACSAMMALENTLRELEGAK